MKSFFKSINWKIRFNKENYAFILRFIIAVVMPILVYFGLEAKDMTTWQVVWETILQAVSNPYVVFMSIFNAINVLFDPTTKGLGDSERALNYTKFDK